MSKGWRAGIVMVVWWLAFGAQAASVQSVRVSTSERGTRAEVRLDAPVEYQVLELDNPPRLVIDLPRTQVQARLARSHGGVVHAVRSGTPRPGGTRLVFDLDTSVRGRVSAREGGGVVVVEWPSTGPAESARAETLKRTDAANETRRAEVPSERKPTPRTTPTREAPVRTIADVARRAAGRPLLIAIDAGHGGQDTGARGAAGSREKDITLRIARELARQVDATPGMRAFLTRSGDTFIPLVTRYQLARTRRADMFVSVHADAFTDPSASGSSVFVLSQRGSSSQAAKWLAEKENSSDLIGGLRLSDKDSSLASVLLDLSQSATQRASEQIAAQVLRGLADLGKTHRGEIERANFVVLRSPDVPSLLVETAFISNPEEEARLNDPDYQRELARAIVNGIHTYFRRQPPPGTQYAAKYGDADNGE